MFGNYRETKWHGVCVCVCVDRIAWVMWSGSGCAWELEFKVEDGKSKYRHDRSRWAQQKLPPPPAALGPSDDAGGKPNTVSRAELQSLTLMLLSKVLFLFLRHGWAAGGYILRLSFLHYTGTVAVGSSACTGMVWARWWREAGSSGHILPMGKLGPVTLVLGAICV